MTRIKYRTNPVWHESGLIDRMTGRSFVVAESPAALLIRLKGKRQVLSLPWSVAYLRAAMLKATADTAGKPKRQQAVVRGRV